jgi:hypothetical protein
MLFLTCSWRFLIFNRLVQLEFKLGKILGFRNMQEKLENSIDLNKLPTERIGILLPKLF